MVVETSRPIVDVARELGINETSLGNWVRAYREKHAGDEPPLQLPERARLRELERENRELRMKNDFLSKAAAYFASGASVSEVYEFIDAEYATAPAAPAITLMCRWLESLKVRVLRMAVPPGISGGEKKRKNSSS